MLEVIVAYVLTGAYHIVRDFRVPFHSRPAYARGHSFLIGATMHLVGWLPLDLFKAMKFRLWREAFMGWVVFALLLAFAIYLRG
jgi:hypothetical protein